MEYVNLKLELNTKELDAFMKYFKIDMLQEIQLYFDCKKPDPVDSALSKKYLLVFADLLLQVKEQIPEIKVDVNFLKNIFIENDNWENNIRKYWEKNTREYDSNCDYFNNVENPEQNDTFKLDLNLPKYFYDITIQTISGDYKNFKEDFVKYGHSYSESEKNETKIKLNMWEKILDFNNNSN
jgi:hypothetical protein